MKKALIIGGAGFIGANIVRYLLVNTSYKIDVVDNHSRHARDSSAVLDQQKTDERVRFFNLDLTLTSGFSYLDDDYDYVYMLAAMVGVDKVNSVPHEVIRVNSMLVLNTLEWLRTAKCGRVLFSSTSEAYAGTVDCFDIKVPTNESVPLTVKEIGHPRFTYAVTKMLGESGFINYAKQGFFETIIVRFHNVYGPNMGFRHVIPHLVERFSRKENPFLIYGHNQTRAFNFIDDAVTGTVLALERGKPQEIYHLGDQDEISIETLTRYVGEQLGFGGEYKYADTFPGSVSRRCPDISKARRDLGYNPVVNWKDGLDETLAWYQDHLATGKRNDESFYDQYGINN